mmetsp:Transcript_39312/g.94596  ORF Transcript_39312/g.94596 Transcript_39312/m.94596 type:complete len:290 (+) Transcript_39312:240-1109(+)
MIAERAIHSHSTSMLNELEIDGYCDFGFPIGHGASWEFANNNNKLDTNNPATLPRVSSSKLDLRSSKLDEVTRTFAKVLVGNDIDTAKLLKACRAHLELMKIGGAALCLVARDLENNLRKAEAVFARCPGRCKTLASLLELEREAGIHDGNVLRESSAAMGLLWIRRSLAFQSRLYELSLVPSGDRDDGLGPPRRRLHPKDAAYDSYEEHLSPYHGWMLRRVFPASLSQMPHRDVFLSKFGEVEMEDLDDEVRSKIVRKLRALIGTLEPLIGRWKESFVEFDLEDIRRV